MATRVLAAAVAGEEELRTTQDAATFTRKRGRSGAPASESTVTAAQVEAALNRKNVDELPQDLGSRAATVLPDEAVADADSDAASWLPDQETGVFVPAESAASDGPPAASVLDQTVFVRDEEMQDVERPAVDVDNGDAK